MEFTLDDATTAALDLTPSLECQRMHMTVDQFLSDNTPPGSTIVAIRAGLSGLPEGKSQRMIARLPREAIAPYCEREWLHGFYADLVVAVGEFDGTKHESPVRVRLEIMCLPVSPHTRARSHAAVKYARELWAWGPW